MQSHTYILLRTCCLTRNMFLGEVLKPVAILLLTPTNFVVGAFGETVLSLNDTVITSFARCYSIHLHIFYHAAY